jgi:4-oxalocrotonate tautomerase family enzyme
LTCTGTFPYSQPTQKGVPVDLSAADFLRDTAWGAVRRTKGDTKMPVIRIDIGKKSITARQKKQLIERFTDTAVEITKIPRHAFYVIINEYADADYAVGGKTLDKVRKS